MGCVALFLGRGEGIGALHAPYASSSRLADMVGCVQRTVLGLAPEQGLAWRE